MVVGGLQDHLKTFHYQITDKKVEGDEKCPQ